MTATLPAVPDIAPPPLPTDVLLPVLWKRWVGGDECWYRSIKIPLHAEGKFWGLWKKEKRTFLERGFNVTKKDGVWSLYQWLAGAAGAYTLTAVGANILATAMQPPKATTGELRLVPAEVKCPELPNGLEKKLLAHQPVPARQLYRALSCGNDEWGYPGAVDFSGVGLGKTYQDLAAALATGRSVGVICPPVGRVGWMKAFKHFGAGEPEFLETYEGIRGGFRPHIAARDREGQFRWKDPENLMLILDEAQACFPFETLISTELGPLPIGEIVERQLAVSVHSFNTTTGKVEMKPISNWFRNPNAPLLKIHHEHGTITCTHSHKIWIAEKGWTCAKDISKNDSLRLLPGEFYGASEDQPILREPVQLTGEENEKHNSGGRSLSALLQEIPCGPAASELPAMRAGVSRMDVPQATVLLQKVRLCLALSRRNESLSYSRNKSGSFSPDEAEQPHGELGSQGEDDEIPTGANLPLSWRKRPTDPSADCIGGPASVANGVCYLHGAADAVELPECPQSLQSGYCRPIGETLNRGGWEHAQTEEVAVSGSKEDRDFEFSRVASIEILEPGDRRGFAGGSGEGALYDFEVADNHCYFAAGVLVHNCRHSDTLTVEAFSAAIRQKVPMIAASATIAISPLEFRFAGRIIGLHDGGKDWERFLSQHGCSQKTRGGPWTWNKDRRHLQAIHHRLFPMRGCRVRNEDLGDACPETEISVLPFAIPQSKEMEEQWHEAMETVARLQRQGKPPASVASMRQQARMRIFQRSENLLVPHVGERMRQDIREGWSVAAFLTFNESRLALARILNTTAGFYGGLPQKRREYFTEEFQADRIHALVSNIKSGGSSVSLHDLNGDRPRRAYVFPNDAPILMAQAFGRVARVGAQSKSEQFIPCIAGVNSKSITERMVGSIREKLRNLDTLNDGDAENGRF